MHCINYNFIYLVCNLKKHLFWHLLELTLVLENGTDTIYYRYDGNNDIISMNLNGTEYFYVRNLQNDIVALLDASGAVVVEYQYDTFGKLLSTTGSLASTVGVKNPYLYRGYRYDTETSLYYLQSRYYNPEIGRFINADDTSILQATQGQLLSHNLFAYCGNNPVMGSDPSGYLYIKYATIFGFVDWIRRNALVRNFTWAGGPASMKLILATYIPIFFSWLNALPPIGWIVFAYICANVVLVATGLTTAYFSKKGVDFFWCGFILWSIK